jgi:hypothetical protein
VSLGFRLAPGLVSLGVRLAPTAGFGLRIGSGAGARAVRYEPAISNLQRWHARDTID